MAMDKSIANYFLLFVLAYLIRKLLLSGVKGNNKLPPSPGFSLPIIGHLYLLKKPLHRNLAKLSEQHGPILFLQCGARPVVLVSSPSAAEECFTKNDIVFANRPQLLAGRYLGYDYTTLVWASYGPYWRNLRRIAITEILSSQRLQAFSAIRLDEVRYLIRSLFLQASKGTEFKSLDMKSAFFELMLNVMMRMIAGKRFYEEGETGLEENRKFKEIVTESFQLSGAVNIADFLPVLKRVPLTGLTKRLEILQRKRDKFMQTLVEEQRKQRRESHSHDSTESNTMVDVLLTLQDTEPEHYSDSIIRGMMQVMLSAGSDTSAGTMEWALSLLLNNPEALVKAQVELDTNIGHSRLLEESDITNLPYLRGIINETLRMYPAGPLLAPHESSEECAIAGYHVPKGTTLLVNMWSIQNDPSVWAEPRMFRPERFLGAEKEREGFIFLPFGAGRRGCPGEALATKMIGLALGSLIQCFEWRRVGEQPVDMSEGPGLTMPKAQPLLANFRPRPAMVKLLSGI